MQQITNWISQAGQNISNTIGTFLQPFNGVIQNAQNLVSNAYNGAVNYIQQSNNQATSSYDMALKVMQNQMANTGYNAAQQINQAYNIPQQNYDNQINNLQSQIASIGASVSNANSGIIGGLTNAISQMGNNIQGNLSSFLNNYTTQSQNGFQNVINSFGNIINPLAQTLGFNTANMGNQIANAIGSLVQNSNVQNSQLASSVAAIANQTSQVVSSVASSINSGFLTESQLLAAAIEHNSKQTLIKPEDFTNPIFNFITTLFNQLETDVKVGSNSIEKVFEDKLSFIAGELGKANDHAKSIISKVIHGEYASSNDLFNDLGIDRSNSSLVTSFAELIAFIFIVTQVGTSYLHVVGEQVTKLANADIQPNMLSPNDYITMYHWGLGNTGTLYEALAKLGYSSNLVDQMETISWTQASVQDLINWQHKGVFDDIYMQLLGVNSEQPRELEKIANVNSILFDKAFKDFQASYVVPEIDQLVDMFRRGIIDATLYNGAISHSRIAPVFREKLIEQSQQLLTRRDLNNLYKTHIITEDEVYQGYIKLGYAPQQANVLKEYTKRYGDNFNPDGFTHIHNLSMASVEQAYKRGIVDHEYAHSFLTENGYHEDESSLLLSLWDSQNHVQARQAKEVTHKQKAIDAVLNAYARGALPYSDAYQDLLILDYTENEVIKELSYLELEHIVKRKSDIEEHVKRAYIENTIDNGQVVDVLSSNGFSQNEIELIINEASIYQMFRHKKPAQAELKHWWKKGFITDDEYANELKGLGYHDTYIPYFLAE